MPSQPDVLTLKCPFCGHAYTDDYECLESGPPDLLRCENRGCGGQFAFLIRECTECGEESVFTWKALPASETLTLLSCNRCGAPFDETAGEGQNPNPAQRI